MNMNQTIFDDTTGLKSNGYSWSIIAKSIDEYHNTSYYNRLNGSGEALRSAYRRFKRRKIDKIKSVADEISLPVSLPMMFEQPLTLDNKPTLLIADLHCPYHHEQFIKDAVIRATIEQIIIGGDLLDLDALSKYSKSHHIARLETELEITGKMLLYLAQFAPVYITQGNHDNRFFDKLDSQLSFQRLISAALNGRQPINPIITTDRDYVFVGDHFVVGHTDRFSSTAGKVAYGIAQKYQRHALTGHDHICNVYMGDSTAKYIGASIGCMADSTKFWYSERRLNSLPFMKRGYAILDGNEDYFSLYDENHTEYFRRYDGYNAFKV